MRTFSCRREIFRTLRRCRQERSGGNTFALSDEMVTTNSRREIDCDVVLKDGGTVRLRSPSAADGAALGAEA
jgi:hypothetical protein